MTQWPTNIAIALQCARFQRAIAMPIVLGFLSACASRDIEVDSNAPDASVAEPDLRGTVELAYVERPDGASELEYSVALDDMDRVQLVFATDPELSPGTELEVWGEWEGDSRLIVRDFQVMSTLKRLDAPWIRKPMLHRVAVLSADGVSVSEADVAREMAEVNRFYTETTRGMDTFEMQVYRNYKLGLSTTDCDDRGGVQSRLTTAFTQDGFDPANYDHLVFIVPTSCGSWRGASAIVGAVGDDGRYSVRIRSIYKDDVAHAYPFIHELGHNLGMRHAQSAKCTGSLYTPLLAGCSIEDYGDSNDPMGGGWTEVYWNTPHQRFFGWIAPERAITAGGSGTFNLIPMDAKQGCGIQALRIPIPDEPAKYFYVEYRKARSDSAYAGTGTNVRGDAVLITRSQDGLRNDSSTQRIELGTTRFEGALVGSTYDLGSGVSVTVRSMGPQVAQVVVQAPGTNPHRDDAGGSVAKLSDGSVGPTSCAAPPADGCPSDPNKTEPGQCGCGVPEGSCGSGGANCVTANEGATASLSCPSGHVIQAIAFASYGVPSGACPNFVPGACHAPNSQSAVQSLCLNKQSCSVAAHNNVFADPCGGVSKKLAISYTCGVGSADNCPSDPNKTEPGQCGCGVADTDRDGDLAADCMDGCPADAAKLASGICGCGVADTDSDGDGTANCRDGCPADSKKIAPGVCGCGVAEGTCGPTTVSLPAQDAYVDAARRTQNFGAATTLRVDSSPSQRSLLKPIGLSNIPKGSRVESATLVIRVVDGGNTMSARKLTTAWSQGNVRFNTAPAAASAFAKVSGATGTKTIDVTSIVQAWVNGEAVHGIGLYPTGSDAVVMPSAQNSAVQNRPTFRITYRRSN